MKNIIILLGLCLILNSVKAQKKQNVYYFKSNGKEVNSKDSADYIRVIQEPDSGEVNFNLLEFYVNGKKKSVGKVSAFEPRLVYNGVIIRFDTAGKRKEITTYEKGVPLGMSYRYLSNGKLHKQIEYFAYTPPIQMVLPGVGFSEVPFNPNSKLIYFADSLGVEQVKDGNGYVKTVAITGKNEQREEGGYTDGVKHGVWKGSGSGYEASFVETYEMGKLISGESTKDGVKYPYTDSGQPPSFKGGMKKFYEAVGYSVRYPADAAKNRIGGTVIVEFTVERDGKVTEVEVKKSVYPSLDDEAKRVVKSSPKWMPGTIRGIPVRVKYSIPLKFTMP